MFICQIKCKSCKGRGKRRSVSLPTALDTFAPCSVCGGDGEFDTWMNYDDARLKMMEECTNELSTTGE
jgi:DnaJ-class molecular chaperone